MVRKALVVGIDYYESMGSLYGCVNDARSVEEVLAHHGDADHDINFTPVLLTATSEEQAVSKQALKSAVRRLFEGDAQIALFFFAGHGYVKDTGGFLCTSDCETGDDGLALSEVMTLANQSNAMNKMIILDSCYSGIAGSRHRPTQPPIAEIAEGVTILTASMAEESAMELDGSGLFTRLFVDALNGAAANLVGDITPGSVYALIDQSLGPFVQRPMFRTNVKTFVSLRRTTPAVAVADLRKITTYFPTRDYRYPLDPSYEPERSPDQFDDPSIPPPEPDHTEIFATLQKYAKVNLIRPIDARHMWHAAMQSKSCELTALGRHYWNLVTGLLI